jgi:environmental stress-induced protein Ves
MPRLLRADARAAQPWRNGAGITREVATDVACAQFGWRVSIATIDRDAPFSRFAGYDRTLVHVAGGALALALPDRRITLTPGGSIAFAGEAVVSACVAAPATVLNVMTARARYAHRVDRLEIADDIAVRDASIVIALTDGLRAGDVMLRPLDALAIAAGEAPMTLSGNGTAMGIAILPRD